MKDIVFHPAADPVMVRRWWSSTQLCFVGPRVANVDGEPESQNT